MLDGSYDSLLVLFSLAVAILASYTTLVVAGRIATSSGRPARWWLAGGACTMGIGIWSMHFIGMLAFDLPIDLGYDLLITLLSLLFAVAASAFALWIVTQETLSYRLLAAGALVMGVGVAGMHYTGMASMRMMPGIVYDTTLLGLSVLVAIAGSAAAIWCAFVLRRRSAKVDQLRIGAAAVMGLTIAGMHYIGMAAAEFPAGSICGAAQGGVQTYWLGLTIILATLAILAIALIVSVLDQRMESRTALLAKELADANQELTYLALHDNLTKLPNRVLLEDRLGQAMERARREKIRFALMFMDLDGFKAVNDVYGHLMGDMLLVAAAGRIVENTRGSDTVARVGGDEFVVLAQVDEPTDAGVLASKLVAAIGEPYLVNGHELHVSTSIGIAIYPGNGESQDELLTNADAAMYHVKGTGRDDYCFFEASMTANAHGQVQLLQDLRMALKRNELVLYYQPKFTAPHGPITGLEALLRWKHPAHGMLGPVSFIPLAEKTGLIVPIGEWVLNEACRQMAEWRDDGREDWTIAVNLSAVQLAHSGLVEAVRGALDRHGLEPHRLVLEITESTAMRDVDSSQTILQRLHDIGVRISIDDFGTGYSSLLYLKRLPASELKIDRCFVHDLACGTEDAAIVSAIVALGQTLDLRVVAEGVETAEQQEFLTSLGCDTLQGYLLAYPMQADEVIVLSNNGELPDNKPAAPDEMELV
ncbi:MULTISPECIES: putative bifunctional diguanylate cyclase/phosphodiesterase [Pseudomonadota]|uniref:Probable signalling protein n=1 Tax=Bordetella petrii (strain ATCC BAA-461 / DSM 12804 / CCUG 43448 / CIP 107267 / Se-1111R) TaxID=340100 RepID=A9IE75_BORPD|nr:MULTISPECIES: EAL domain-containing protein [Pseudomonadota]CAP41698.1 probable signalling protein [Bordetella petrii]HCK4605755.1 EAL domain-containing protein [Pseudomonas aeruginosa]